MKRFPAMLTIAGALVVFDQATKLWFLKHYQLGESHAVLPFMSFTLVKNTGTAFGMLQGNNHLLFIVSLIILGVFLYCARGLSEHGGTWAFLGVSLIIGGAVGNLLDRYFYSQVIDFLDFRIWPVFNVADSAITVGAVSLLLGWMRHD